MPLPASIFLDFSLSATTWFYLSGLLAVALFFKFSRLLSIRNLDVLTLYLFAPGLLLLAEHGEHDFLAYAWLLGACLYFLIRCMLDLTFIRRPALGPNLDLSGLAWMGGALFLGLIGVAIAQPTRPPQPEVPRPSSPTEKLAGLGKSYVEQYGGTDNPLLEEIEPNDCVERTLAILCHLSVVVGLVLVGWRHLGSVQSGMSAATFYLLLPYNFFLLPDSPTGVGRWDHAWPMALLVWAIFCYRRPVLAGMFFGIATGTAYFVVMCLPAWWGFYRQRGAVRFLGAYALSAGLVLTVLGALLWQNGEPLWPLRSDWTTFDWQPWERPRPQTPGFWQDMPSDRVARMPAAYRVPVFIGSLALVFISGLWPNPKNLAHVLALSAASLIGIQFWYADRGGAYVLWFLPLLLLLMFRPNLDAAVPQPPPRDDLLARVGNCLWARAERLVRSLVPVRWKRRRLAAPRPSGE